MYKTKGDIFMKLQVIFTASLSAFLAVMVPAYSVDAGGTPAPYSYHSDHSGHDHSDHSGHDHSDHSSSTVMTLNGPNFPYSLTYDTALWEILYGDPGSGVDYNFIKKTGNAKVFVEFVQDEVHYTEVVPALVEELRNGGLQDVEVIEFGMSEFQGRYLLHCQFSCKVDGTALTGFVFFYLTQQGMFRIAFVTDSAELDYHMEDFNNIFEGLQFND